MLGRIAGYELLEEIGRSQMSVVFRAREPRLGQTVAVKILHDALARDPETRERFRRGARAQASLSHPTIAVCFTDGEAALDPPSLLPSDTPGLPPEPKKLYLVMEFIQGSDLSAQVNGRPLAISRVLDLVGQIAEGLEVAHVANVVHRDLKPANVRVTPDGHVKLLDFGIAAIIPTPESGTDGLQTSNDHVMGTWPFMSPEQTRGRTIDPRSDLFSLGTIIYVLVTGRPPFTGATCSEVGDAIRHAEPPPMARYANGVSDELERIVRKLHAKDPDDRYQSAHEVRTDIARLQEGWHRRRHVLRAVLLTLCAALVSVASWMAWRAWMPPTAVAVVPFVNQTGDPRLDYLGDGLAVNLNGTLIRGSHLSVAGASAVKGISLENRTPKYLAHELGVDAALTGSLNKHDGQLSLDLELLKCPKGFVIWAESYDYDVVASGDVERQIVRDVVYRLSGPFGGGKLPKPKPVVSSAYDRYLRARAALDDPDDAAPERALADLEQALAQDPDFALAWACRSLALWKIWNRDHTDASLRLAEEAADRAVQLNPELLEARLARAQVYRATSRYADAISELSDVLRVNPNWDEAELQLGATYREAGIISKAELHFWHATQVRPGFWRNWNSLGDLRFQQLGDYVGAREAYRKVIDLAPERNIGYTRLAALETAAGQYPAAIELYDRLPKPVEDGATLSNMGIAYLFTHRLEDSRRYFGRAVQVMPRDIDLWINLGDLHTRAGRPDSAQVCYENALQLADDQLHVDPRNRKLRVERIQCLAKVGHCDEVHAAFAARADTLPSGSADLTHRLAKAYALCGSRAEALAAARKAAEMGISPTLLRDEDEFAALKSQPAFPK